MNGPCGEVEDQVAVLAVRVVDDPTWVSLNCIPPLAALGCCGVLVGGARGQLRRRWSTDWRWWGPMPKRLRGSGGGGGGGCLPVCLPQPPAQNSILCPKLIHNAVQVLGDLCAPVLTHRLQRVDVLRGLGQNPGKLLLQCGKLPVDHPRSGIGHSLASQFGTAQCQVALSGCQPLADLSHGIEHVALRDHCILHVVVRGRRWKWSRRGRCTLVAHRGAAD
mmetsp:Transcript_49739/g.115395  ORF Transcript_49739/g.115395 Transcript_49739/m.115395 type:complete len:220 (-) Transcript_49739:73-732(-)